MDPIAKSFSRINNEIKNQLIGKIKSLIVSSQLLNYKASFRTRLILNNKVEVCTIYIDSATKNILINFYIDLLINSLYLIEISIFEGDSNLPKHIETTKDFLDVIDRVVKEI